MNGLKALVRLCRAVAHVFRGLWIIWRHFERLTAPQRMTLVQSWSLQLLKILGIELQSRGELLNSGPLLLVGNHISWLDILVVLAVVPARFVSKSDVKSWPVIGQLVSGAGTLYIERTRTRDSKRVVDAMAAALANGDVLAVFPEGTTSDGARVLPFHGNLLQAAINVNAPVLPFALRYLDAATGEASMAPTYIDDDHFVGSVWRLVKTPGVLAVVRLGELQTHAGRTRRAWAADLREQVAQAHGSLD